MDSNFFLDIMSDFSYFGFVLGMMLEGIIIIIPSEIILAVAGVLVSKGVFTMPLAVFFGTVGSVLCAILLYGIGYIGGRPFVEKYGKFFFINARDLKKADEWFLKHGRKSAFFGRFLPIIRTFISIPMGISRTNFFQFVLYTTLGSIPWTFLFIYIGYRFSESYEQIIEYVDYVKYPVAIIILVMVFIYVKKHLKKSQ